MSKELGLCLRSFLIMISDTELLSMEFQFIVVKFSVIL